MLPIFPLPNVVLFPNVCLPLHIFEDRYRIMVGDALRGDRMIGMVLLRATGDSMVDEVPAVYPVGCAGLITHSEKLDDGRYNIVLRGLEKFRIIEEDRTRPYRRARVETISETLSSSDALTADRARLEHMLDRRLAVRRSESRVPPDMADTDLVNALSQYLDLDPVEKQALLERDGVRARCRSLVELLEMKAFLADRDYPYTALQ